MIFDTNKIVQDNLRSFYLDHDFICLVSNGNVLTLKRFRFRNNFTLRSKPSLVFPVGMCHKFHIGIASTIDTSTRVDSYRIWNQ